MLAEPPEPLLVGISLLFLSFTAILIRARTFSLTWIHRFVFFNFHKISSKEFPDNSIPVFTQVLDAPFTNLTSYELRLFSSSLSMCTINHFLHMMRQLMNFGSLVYYNNCTLLCLFRLNCASFDIMEATKGH